MKDATLKAFAITMEQHVNSIHNSLKAIDKLEASVLERGQLVTHKELKAEEAIPGVLEAHQHATVHVANIALAVIAMDSFCTGIAMAELETQDRNKLLALGSRYLSSCYSMLEDCSKKLKIIATALGLFVVMP